MGETENSKIPRDGTIARAVYDRLARGPMSFGEAVETYRSAAANLGRNPQRKTASFAAALLLKKYGKKLGIPGSAAAWVMVGGQGANTSPLSGQEGEGVGGISEQESHHASCGLDDPTPDERGPLEQERPTTLLKGAKVTYTGPFAPMRDAQGVVLAPAGFNRRLVRWVSPDMGTSTEWASELSELPTAAVDAVQEPAAAVETIEESSETRYLRAQLARSIERDVAMHDSKLAISKMDLLRRMAMRELLTAGNEVARDRILDIVEDSKAKLEAMTSSGTVARDQKS